MLDKLLSKCYNFLKRIIFLQKGRSDIRKLSPDRKKWHDAHSRKLNRQKRKKRKGDPTRYIPKKYSKNIDRNQIVFSAPSIFSIEKNPDETIEFFNEIVYRRKAIGARFFIDLAEVTEVTIDALMYLIAVICDAKSKRVYKQSFRGNMPKNEDAKKVFINSGFLKYFSHNNIDIIPQSNNVKIIRGQLSDPDIAKQLCDFVQEKYSYDKIATRPLYEILVELMGNTKQHAYEESTYAIGLQPPKNWYVYAEEKDNVIGFVFLDTGLGIPATVARRFRERLPIAGKNHHSALIVSAMKGEYNRSQTKMKNRGRGLPQISQCFQDGLFNKAFVFSGKGSCYLNSETQNEYMEQPLRAKLFGTLFTWTLMKGAYSK